VALTFITWIWGTKYAGHYIARLRNGVRRNYQAPHRFVVIDAWPGDEPLFPGCLCRLRMFSPEWQRRYCIDAGERFVCLDLDLVIAGALDQVFEREEDFVILRGANSANPCPFNGSVMMLRAGAHPEVWTDFSLEEVRRVPRFEFPDDQGWLWHKLPDAAVWDVGPRSGIYAFRKPQWPKDDQLPDDARMVAFPGHRDPSQFTALPWVRRYWV
jgi:hypothetical protein